MEVPPARDPLARGRLRGIVVSAVRAARDERREERVRGTGPRITLAVALSVVMATTALADQPVEAARYRVRHGGRVSLEYFEREHTFERFNSRKAARLDSNLAWVDDEKPHRGQVDIAFTGQRRLLLITQTPDGRWFCSVTSGGGDQETGAGIASQRSTLITSAFTRDRNCSL